MFVRIRPSKSTIRFGKGTKLSPRFIGPFEILEKVGPVAYHLVLPPHLHKTRNVFHVSVLRHYVADVSHKINWKELQVSDKGTIRVEPLLILDRRVKQLRHCLVDQVKVQWERYSPGLLPGRTQRLCVMIIPHYFDHNFGTKFPEGWVYVTPRFDLIS